MKEVRWERMFPDQLEAAFEKCPLVYLTYGLCEPHGPHNALGLDALKAHGIACRAAHSFGGIVAPPDYWHIHEISGYALWAEQSVGEVERSWLTAVPPWIHFKNICYQVRAAEALGFHAILMITGHYGPNWNDLKTLTELIQPYTRARLYSLPDKEANKPGFDGDGKRSGDHAGKVETSLLWAVEPGCVDTSRFPKPDEPGPHFAMGRDARDSDRRIGERMVEDEVRWLGEKAQALLNAYNGKANESRLLTFEDVESFWKQEVEPVLGDFLTMQSRWDSQGEKRVSESSVWFRNSKVPAPEKPKTKGSE
jgi:creatinine amidohydrolase